MKSMVQQLCRQRVTFALLGGLGVGWAMTAAIDLGVGIAIGVVFALSFYPRANAN
jgi:hypothetical protein